MMPPPVLGATLVPRDFPAWLPPMLVKELRQGLRTRGFVGTLVCFQLIMLLLALGTLSAQNSNPTTRAVSANVSASFFWAILSVQLLIITPSRALGGLQAEADTRTLDLLVLTRLNAWRIVLGKWISLLAQATLLLTAMMPYLVVRYFTDNADLVAELGRCLMMLGACAVLSAAGLWGSGVAKFVRVLLAILMGFLMLNVLGFSSLFSGRASVSRSPFGNLLELPIDLANGLLITAFFLVSAVRNIAPAAENHALFTRILPLLALLAAAIAEASGAHQAALRQLYLAAGFLGCVLVFELATGRAPMAAQWRDWYRRGALSRMIGRCALPGWPSAFVFGLVATTSWIAGAMVILPWVSSSGVHVTSVIWLTFLAFAGIIFPALVQSTLRRVPVPPALLYFMGLGVPALLSAVALWLAESRWRFSGMKSVMETLPFSSFLFRAGGEEQAPAIVVAQGAVALLVLVVAAWQTRGYWRRLGEFEIRDRTAIATETSKPA